MRAFYSEKLWAQLTETLLGYVEDSKLGEHQNLINLYNGFIKEFELKIDPIKFVQMAMIVSDQFPTAETKIAFLKNVGEKLADEQAKILNNLKIGLHLLNDEKIEEALQVIKDVQKKIEKMSDLDPLIYSYFYRLSSRYYAKKRNYEEFYKNGLQYLAYTHESRIKPQEKVEISVDMATAILVSKKIYNFSELLEQPVLKALKNSPQEWIYHMIEVFNGGNIPAYETTIKKYHEHIKSNPVLVNNEHVLNEKIRIMSLLELIFHLPKNDRNLPFQAIAKVTTLPLEHVELLVMKAMSLGLLKGTIDQVEALVKVTWIMPRVLDTDRIGIMREKIDQWKKGLDVIIRKIEKEDNKMIIE
jgi:26S proteasome regulatory subunit N9